MGEMRRGVGREEMWERGDEGKERGEGGREEMRGGREEKRERGGEGHWEAKVGQ